MKVSVRFNEQGLKLILDAESEAEKLMIGAVLGQPKSDLCDLSSELIWAKVRSDGHFSQRRVSALEINVMKDQT